jgi:hypothetical protein
MCYSLYLWILLFVISRLKRNYILIARDNQVYYTTTASHGSLDGLQTGRLSRFAHTWIPSLSIKSSRRTKVEAPIIPYLELG